MRKKRLIFTLLYDNGNYMLSRNFRLQKVGDAQWINQNYNFKNISFAIDELVIIDVTREKRHQEKFIESFSKIINNVFVPISIGGGITNFQEAKNLFLAGADKIVVNSLLEEKPQIIHQIRDEYGSQAIVASVDFKQENNNYLCYNHNGQKLINCSAIDYIHYLEELKVGELYLNSIDKDGTGQGYDVNFYYMLEKVRLPIIAAGGAGKTVHFEECLDLEFVDAVATANLFNFIGNALPTSRKELLTNNYPLAKFEF